MNSQSQIQQEFKPSQVLYEGVERIVLGGHLAGFGDVVIKKVKNPRQLREVDRLSKEFLVLEGVTHPNWVEVLAYRQIAQANMPTSPAIVMKPVPGRTATAFRVTPGWDHRKLEIARQILAALDALHRMGYVHLDLHPGQILIDAPADNPGRAPRVTLLDLGLAAQRATRITRRGTLGFIAPEVFSAAESTAQPEADLFCFGLLLHYLISGRFPVEGVPDHEKSQLHREGVVPDLRVTAPESMVSLVASLLSPRPSRRPPSAADIWRQLRDTVDHDATTLPPRLTRAVSFPFRARNNEVKEFTSSLEVFERSPGALRVWQYDGELGIGKRRLIAHLAAHAQCRDWVLSPVVDPSRLELHREEKVINLHAGAPRGRDDLIAGATASTISVHALQPLPRDVLQRMIRDNRFETEALVQATTNLCMGNPGLLAALVEKVPDFLDLAGPYLETIGVESHLETPHYWIEWVRALIADERERSHRLGPANEQEQDEPPALDALLACSLAGAAQSTGSIEQALGWRRGSIRDVLRPWIERECILDDGERTRVRSSLWQRAIEAADPQSTRQVGTRVLGGQGGSADPVSLAFAAARIGDACAFWAHASTAMEALAAEDRIEDVFRFGVEALNMAKASNTPIPLTLAEQILEAATFLGPSDGQRLPEWLPQQEPPGLQGTPHGAMLCAWACLGHGEPAKGLRRLQDLEKKLESPELLLAHLYLSCLGTRTDGDESMNALMARIDEASTHPLLQDSAAAYSVRRIKILVRGYSSDVTERAKLFAKFPGSVRATWGPARRAQYSRDVAGGSYGESQPLTELQNALQTWQHLGCRYLYTGALSALGGHLFEAGQVERSLSVVRMRFEYILGCPNPRRAAGELFNMAALLVIQGRLRAAFEAATRAEALVSTETAMVAFPRELCTGVAASALVLGGCIDEGLSVIDQLIEASDSSRFGLDAAWLETRGVALLRLGEAELGGADLQEAHDQFLRIGERSDALDCFISWLDLELEAGHQDAALDMWERIRKRRSDLTPLSARRFDLIEEELYWMEWLPAGVDEFDFETRTKRSNVDSTAWQLWQWRPLWRRARWSKRRGNLEETKRFYESAGRKLLDLTNYALGPRFADSFLRLPLPVTFRAELENWTTPGSRA